MDFANTFNEDMTSAKSYLSVNSIQAKPMAWNEYQSKYRPETKLSDVNPAGYCIWFTDGHVEWMEKKHFHWEYFQIDDPEDPTLNDAERFMDGMVQYGKSSTHAYAYVNTLINCEFSGQDECSNSTELAYEDLIEKIRDFLSLVQAWGTHGLTYEMEDLDDY